MRVNHYRQFSKANHVPCCMWFSYNWHRLVCSQYSYIHCNVMLVHGIPEPGVTNHSFTGISNCQEQDPSTKLRLQGENSRTGRLITSWPRVPEPIQPLSDHAIKKKITIANALKLDGKTTQHTFGNRFDEHKKQQNNTWWRANLHDHCCTLKLALQWCCNKGVYTTNHT